MSGSLGTCISRLTGVYRDPQRVLRDAETLLSSPLGTHLRPTTEPLMLNDGSATPPVLLLRGTLPMTYRGVTYNLPIDMYLPPPYPQRPPTVFIRPVASMAIKENHRHVGLDGRVYLPYLHEWRQNTHDLRELGVWMSSLFGSEPPCYAKPANASTRSSAVSNGSSVASNGHGNHHHHPPPAYSQAAAVESTSSHASAAYNYNSSTSTYASNTSSGTSNAEEERRRAYEKQIADATAASLAAETARQAAAEEARVLAEEKRLHREHEQNLLSMRTMATSKVQSEMHTLFRGMKDELRIELQDQKKLEHGKVQIEKLIKEGRERRVQLTKGNKEMDESIEKLEQWLTAVKEHQSTSSSTTDIDEMSKADLIALPADTHSAQMLALSAENAAIDDCIYFLDRALVRGSIGLDVFLKEVRRLSKRQFLAKVCVLCFNVEHFHFVSLHLYYIYMYIYVAWV